GAVAAGGCGFIWRHVVWRLVEDGHQVVVLDNLTTGRRENLRDLPPGAPVTVAAVDVAEYEAIAPRFDGVDVVFHLAGLADIVPSISTPRHYHRANVDGTVAVVEAARRARVARLVYAASSSCHGIPDICPTPETAPLKPHYHS